MRTQFQLQILGEQLQSMTMQKNETEIKLNDELQRVKQVKQTSIVIIEFSKSRYFFLNKRGLLWFFRAFFLRFPIENIGCFFDIIWKPFQRIWLCSLPILPEKHAMYVSPQLKPRENGWKLFYTEMISTVKEWMNKSRCGWQWCQGLDFKFLCVVTGFF